MDLHSIQGEVGILLVTLCYRNRDKLQPDGPLGSYVDFILPNHDLLFLQYSNVYIPTPEVNQLTHDKKLQEECLNFVGKKGRTSPSFRDVFMLYCGLSPGATVRDLCTRYNPGSLRVDERRLIQFGMVTGIIRRLHKYPVQLTTPESEPVPRSHHKLRGRHRDSDTNRVKLDHKWLDGNHNYDEICCKTGLTYQELEDKVEGDPHIVVIWK